MPDGWSRRRWARWLWPVRARLKAAEPAERLARLRKSQLRIPATQTAMAERRGQGRWRRPLLRRQERSISLRSYWLAWLENRHARSRSRPRRGRFLACADEFDPPPRQPCAHDTRLTGGTLQVPSRNGLLLCLKSNHLKPRPRKPTPTPWKPNPTPPPTPIQSMKTAVAPPAGRLPSTSLKL